MYDLVYIIYKYINEKIKEQKLVEELNKCLNNKNYKNNKKQLKELIENIKKIIEEHGEDSIVGFEKISDLFYENELYLRLCNDMDIHNLRKMITDNFCVPNPPSISQETFDKLVEDCIECDDLEGAWRLYLNYERMKPDKIEDFFIEKKDVYYIVELISIKEDSMDLDRFIDKVIETKDINLIGEIELNNLLNYLLNSEQHYKLRQAARELK